MDAVKILIIDDELDVCEIIYETIKSEYPETIYVTDAEKAIELITTNTFSLILSDINIAKVTGPTLIRMLRSQGKLTPVIFITGNASKETILTALRLGVSDVIEKPFDTVGLIKTVNRILEIDRRKTRFILDNASMSVPTASIEKQKKMLGMLHVLNEQKSDDTISLNKAQEE